MSQISGEGNSYLWRGDKKIGLFFVNCECFTSFSVVFSVNGKRGAFCIGNADKRGELKIVSPIAQHKFISSPILLLWGEYRGGGR